MWFDLIILFTENKSSKNKDKLTKFELKHPYNFVARL